MGSLSEKAPAKFIRHFEDAARIIHARELPALDDYDGPAALATDMVGQKQIARLPDRDDPAFAPRDGERWEAVRAAHAEAAPLFWGPRIDVDEACAVIRGWIGRALR